MSTTGASLRAVEAARRPPSGSSSFGISFTVASWPECRALPLRPSKPVDGRRHARAALCTRRNRARQPRPSLHPPPPATSSRFGASRLVAPPWRDGGERRRCGLQIRSCRRRRRARGPVRGARGGGGAARLASRAAEDSERVSAQNSRPRAGEAPAARRAPEEAEELAERAALVCSFLGYAYLRAGAAELTELPPSLAAPWAEASAFLDRAVGLDYVSTVLSNCTVVHGADDDEPAVRVDATFTGSDDERHFYAIHARVETAAAPAVRAITRELDAVEAAATGAPREDAAAALADVLREAARSVRRAARLLPRMRDGCSPQYFYGELRSQLAGFDAPVTLKGVAGEPTVTLRGASGAPVAAAPVHRRLPRRRPHFRPRTSAPSMRPPPSTTCRSPTAASSAACAAPRQRRPPWWRRSRRPPTATPQAARRARRVRRRRRRVPPRAPRARHLVHHPAGDARGEAGGGAIVAVVDPDGRTPAQSGAHATDDRRGAVGHRPRPRPLQPLAALGVAAVDAIAKGATLGVLVVAAAALGVAVVVVGRPRAPRHRRAPPSPASCAAASTTPCGWSRRSDVKASADALYSLYICACAWCVRVGLSALNAS